MHLMVFNVVNDKIAFVYFGFPVDEMGSVK